MRDRQQTMAIGVVAGCVRVCVCEKGGVGGVRDCPRRGGGGVSSRGGGDGYGGGQKK